MRRTLLSAAAVACPLAMVAATPLAFAQENQKEQQGQAPAAHRMESAPQGQMKGERTGQTAQTRTGEPNKEENAREPGRAMKPGTNAEGAQTEKNRAEEQKGAQAEQGNSAREAAPQAEQRKDQTEKGAQAEQRKDRNGKSQAEERNGQNEKGTQAGAMNNREGQAGERHNVQAMGKAHLSQDQAARVAGTLRGNARPQNVNFNINVGVDVPGDV